MCQPGTIHSKFPWLFTPAYSNLQKKVREKSRECHNHKPQPFPNPKRKRKPTNLNKHKPNKRTKSTKISSLFPKRGNRNTKRTEKHKNKMTHGKTYNKSPRRINHKATRSKTNTWTTALERSVEQTTGGLSRWIPKHGKCTEKKKRFRYCKNSCADWSASLMFPYYTMTISYCSTMFRLTHGNRKEGNDRESKQ